MLEIAISKGVKNTKIQKISSPSTIPGQLVWAILLLHFSVF